MIGLDTDIVLRWLTGDDADPGQHSAALRSVETADDSVYLNDIVIAETGWVLTARYRHPRPVVAAGFRQIMAHPKVRVSNRAAIEAALSAYELGGAGLSDRLIGALNRTHGCTTTLTFDKVAAKGPDFRVIV